MQPANLIVPLIVFCHLIVHLPTTAAPSNSAEYVVNSYMEAIQSYSENFDASHKFHIEDVLLTNPNIKIGCDLATIEDAETAANEYYYFLKTEEVAIKYDFDFTITTCSRNGKKITGCLVKKALYYRDGLVENRQEFLELVQQKNTWKINGIVSNLFNDLTSFDCLQKPPPNSQREANANNCEILNKAEKAYQARQFTQALGYFQQALGCTNKPTYVEKRITELQTIDNCKIQLKKANKLLEQQQFKAALNLYQQLEQVATFLPENQQISIRQNTYACRQALLFERVVADANEYFRRKLYLKALPLYEKALSIQPENNLIKNKFLKCQSLVQQESEAKIKKAIDRATWQLEIGKIKEGFTVLLRYRDSGFLEGIHYFYMAKVLNFGPKAIKKQFDFRKKDCCVLTRQFMLEAKDKGMKSDDFIFFWEAQLNKKSRTCI